MRALVFSCVCVGLSFGLTVTKFMRFPEMPWQFHASSFEIPDQNTDQNTEAPKFQKILDYDKPDGNAHSPSIALNEDGFSVFWFDGTKESANDVVILQSQFDRTAAGWRAGNPELLFSRYDLEGVSAPRQSVLTLGNVISGQGSAAQYFATIVSFGGWAAASIANVEYANGGLSSARKLSLSPWLNRSHLVRAPAIEYADGTLGLPAYFELGKGFGELIRLDENFRVRHKSRMNREVEAIQAVIVPLDQSNAVALSRNFDAGSDRLVANWTADGGQTWTPDMLLQDMPNPSAPVAALLLSTQDILMVFNDSPHDASILKLALSSDQGRTWRRIHTLERGDGAARYPTMVRLPDGDMALTYSVKGKHGIRAYVFNEAWVYSL